MMNLLVLIIGMVIGIFLYKQYMLYKEMGLMNYFIYVKNYIKKIFKRKK